MADEKEASNAESDKKVPSTPPKIAAEIPHKIIESNPFATTQLALKKLFRLNTNTFIGMSAFSLLLVILAILTALAVVVAGLAFAFRHTGLYASGAAALVDAANSMGDVSIYVTWLIGIPLFIGLIGLLKALQLRLVTATADEKQIGFGATLKQSVGRILPLIGLDALVVLGMAVMGIVLSLLAGAIGLIIIPIIIVAVVAFFYVALRLAFASYAIVDEHLGPIAAIKRSWAISTGHFAEIVGIMATAGLVVLAMELILNILIQAGSGSMAISGLVALLGLLAGATIPTLALTGVAERFAQLRDVRDGKRTSGQTHVLNYLAVIILIIVSIVTASVSPKNSLDSNQFGPQLNSGGSHRTFPPRGSFDNSAPAQNPDTQTTPNFY